MRKNLTDNVQLTKRDLELLNFLWIWKVCTTRGLKELFFMGSSYAAYRRLRLLKISGYIRQNALEKEYGSFVWSLTKKGFHTILPTLPQLEEEGSDSEYLYHDLLCMALHLGDWFMGAPEGFKFFSEQQLRRLYECHYPDWVPRLIGHRPDGYVLAPKGRIIAIEVEISRKERKRYIPVARTYADNIAVSRVIWLVKNKADANWLANIFGEVETENIKMHNFVCESDFKKFGWQATIILGSAIGKTLKVLLCNGAIELLQCPSNGAKTLDARLLLDTTKCALDSNSSTIFKNTAFSYSMPLQAYSETNSG